MKRLFRIRMAITALSLAAAGVTAIAAIVPVAHDAAGALSLAHALATDPAVVTGASFQTVPVNGTPHAVADAPLSSFPSNGGTFAILTSGNAAYADDANVSGSTGEALGGAAVRGDTDRDVTVLQIDLNVPATSNCLTVDFQFYSDEFPEYVNSAYNDAFIAELDASTWTTAGSTITAPDNFAFDPSGDVISINSSGNTAMNAADAAGTTYDGATPLLSASTPITPGAHTLYLSIFDQGDQILDSAVFVDNLVLGFQANPEQNCAQGAKPKTYALSLDPAEADNPEGTQHTVTATLLEEGAPLANATIAFEVTGAHTESGTAVTDAAGQAAFTYLGSSVGSDVIAACYDADADGICEALASAQKHWLHVNESPAAACEPTTNPSGRNVPGANASPKAGMNPDGFYQLLAADEDSPAPSVWVGDTESTFVAGPYAPGTKVKISEANGTTPRAKSAPGVISAQILLKGDAKVWAVDDEGASSAVAYCYVPRAPK